MSALAHSEQTERTCSQFFTLRDASTVIADFKHKLIFFLFKQDVYFRRLCVAQNIGHCLLKNAKDSCRLLPAEVNMLYQRIEAAHDPGVGLKLMGMPFDSLIEHVALSREQA